MKKMNVSQFFFQETLSTQLTRKNNSMATFLFPKLPDISIVIKMEGMQEIADIL